MLWGKVLKTVIQNNYELCRLSKTRTQQGLSFQIHKGGGAAEIIPMTLPLQWLTNKPMSIEQGLLGKLKALSSQYKSGWRLNR